MQVYSKIFYTQAGYYYFDAPDLVYVNILSVRRGGMAFEKVSVTPINDFQFRYTDYLGRIEFKSTYPIGSEDDFDGERIFVIYKK